MSEQMQEPCVRPAARLTGLSPYRPPERPEGVDLFLDLNEGAPNIESTGNGIASAWADSLSRYPNVTALESEIAGAFGIDPKRVVVTNGGDDAIDRVCRCVVEPGREGLVHPPTFEMISRGIQLAGGTTVRVPWFGGGFPLEQFADAIGARTALAAIVSPNNPTGGVVDAETIEEIAARARTVGALVLVDLAYVEFADQDPTSALLDLDNVVIVRTFSKAYGLAGARVGYAIASSPVAAWMRTVGSPFPVSAVSIELARSAWRARASRQPFIERVRNQRDALGAELAARGAEALASQGNFVTARFANAERVAGALLASGIGVRRFANSELAEYLRISLPGDQASFARLMDTLDGAIEHAGRVS